MRILILSDLHLEFGTFNPPKVDVDAVVLAGDIDLHARGIRWANDTFSVPVLYLLGNHEFYGSRIEDVIRQCREAAAPHVHLLDRDSVEICGVRFIGCTLWTDFNLFGEDRCDSAMAVAARAMNDFRVIQANVDGWVTRFTPAHARQLHNADRAWLSAQLQQGHRSKTVVITHHAPHKGSLAPRFAHDPIAPAFVSDLSELMGEVPVWIHGHTHDSFDYRVGATRVLCNPRGYVRSELNPSFDPGFIIEVL